MNKKSGFRGSGMGVGYISVMVIFVTVCLTLFATFSLRAASSNDAFNKRSGEFLKSYYSADSKAKQILAELDASAKVAASGFFFEDEFELTEHEGVVIKRVKGGCSADYSVAIDERRELKCGILFKPDGSYEITRWQSRANSAGFNESPGNLWNGEFDF